MTLREFAKNFCGNRSYETDHFYVELEDMEYPFQERVKLTSLFVLNLKEKCWLDHEVLYIHPAIVCEKFECSLSYEARVIIHISNTERIKDGN